MRRSPAEQTTRAPRWPAGDEGGFVMVMVILLLFAVAVAGATGYQIVQAEADLSSGTKEVQEALTAARSGLDRYVGEHIGVPGDTTTYVIGNADVYVIPRRLSADVSPAIPDHYLIESIAEVADARYPGSPARRTVRQYARLIKNPVNVKGAVMSTATDVNAAFGNVHGTDQAPANARGGAVDLVSGDCVGNPAQNIFGTVARTTGGTNPATGGELALGTAQAVIDSASVAWAVIENPNFPVHYHAPTLPPFATYPDSFFVVRYPGNLAAGTSHSGKGVLIVAGALSIANFSAFTWNGIVLAGAGTTIAGNVTSTTIRGALVTGLDGGSPGTFNIGGGFFSSPESILNHSCNIAQANRVLAYFELIDNSRWEF